jgi:hypothetical protein
MHARSVSTDYVACYTWANRVRTYVLQVPVACKVGYTNGYIFNNSYLGTVKIGVIKERLAVFLLYSALKAAHLLVVGTEKCNRMRKRSHA